MNSNICSPEIWKDIPGYEGVYMASDKGRIKSLDRVVYYSDGRKTKTAGRVLKGVFIISGYLTVTLTNPRKRELIHRIIAKTFITNENNKPQVNHKNGIKTDNRAENLEWVSLSENVIHALKNNLSSCKGGTHYKAIKIVDIQTGVVYDTIKEAARRIPYNYTNIKKHIKNNKGRFIKLNHGQPR